MSAFEIVVHDADSIVEVVYPANPTREAIADYTRRVTAIINARPGDWCCLVDQRALQVLSPELVEGLTALNAYAQAHGMVRAARVVSTAVAGLQAARIAREAGLASAIRTFSSRGAALSWLQSESDARSDRPSRPYPAR